MTNFDESYIKVYGWMRDTVHLKGATLLVFATIYGLSEEGTKECAASEEWLADYIGISVRTVVSSLNYLANIGLIDQMSGNGRTRRSTFTAATWELVKSVFRAPAGKIKEKYLNMINKAKGETVSETEVKETQAPVAAKEEPTVSVQTKEEPIIAKNNGAPSVAKEKGEVKAETQKPKVEKKNASFGPFVVRKDRIVNEENQTPQAKAWKKFFNEHPNISIDSFRGDMLDIDFEVLSQKIADSDFLQSKTSFTWLVRHWAKIKEGYYDTYKQPDPWKELLKDAPKETNVPPHNGVYIAPDGTMFWHGVQVNPEDL